MADYIKNSSMYMLLCAIVIFISTPSYCLDTEVYQADVKQNAYILLDNSGSMDYGVYESNIDYGNMYDYLFIKPNIGDTIVGGNGWYQNHFPKNKIFLVMGKIGVTIINVDGKPKVFAGDAANPDYLWYAGNMVDTHTYIDNNGNLSGEQGEIQRITVDDEGYILLDGQHLPLGQDILLKDFKTLYDGSIINDGFGGIINAPGYYFSGLEGVDPSAHNQVEDGDEKVYFFITGNWMNMQQMYNLHYTSNPGSYASKGDPAWKYEKFPIIEGEWSTTSLDPAKYDYPHGSDDYENNRDKTLTVKHPGATEIQIHFSLFDIERDHNKNSWNYDYVALYDSANNLVAKYDNDNSPQGSWSPSISGDTIIIKFHSDQSVTGQGFTIDKYRYAEGGSSYLMQNRLDVAKDAISYVLEEFRGKINWGFATFNYTGSGYGDGAKLYQVLNPSLSDDANRAAIEAHMKNIEPKYGTPLGEALQDIYEQGYHKKTSVLSKMMCRRNFVIVVSDGYPSSDNSWSRTSYVNPFDDFDGDGFTADPYQYNNPPANYYDDVATWISHHSWIDGSTIPDSEINSSYENITPHQISFGAKHPLMHNAADESGAQYITAYNKTQLVNAFYSLGLMISQAVSFTSPVVSVAADNKIENGNDIYMGLFLPMDSAYWKGNIKHFQFGDGSTNRPDKWAIYDDANNIAWDDEALRYLDNTDGYWGDDHDPNDSNDNNGAAEIDEDGVGEVLTERVQADFNSGNYYERNIKTWIDDGNPDTANLVDFTQNNVSPSTLGLEDDDLDTRNKVVNWVYGYTFNADSASGHPIAANGQSAVRDWVLGPIIHSKPTIIDYYKTNDTATVDKRYIAIGADDGMLHIFYDSLDSSDTTNGKEVFAFVPDDALTKLPKVETSLHESFVDGPIKLYRENGAINGAPKYLFFGLRRGGTGVWRVNISDNDPANWTVDKFIDSEMGQSWSDFSFARIRTGESSYKNVIIFSGGYDPVEDMFPEPFKDNENDPNGTPFTSNGNIDPQEWKANNSDQDINGNNKYDIINPNTGAYATTKGRAIYIVDIDTLDIVFSAKYNSSNLPAEKGTFSNKTAQTRDDFIYCFPATPSVVVTSHYISNVRQDDLLTAIYAPDIYGNIFRIAYDYNNGNPEWQIKHIFSANPGSSSSSGAIDIGIQHIDSSDTGRKVFYGPAVSWHGTKGYFEASKYSYPDAAFNNTDSIASLFFGTGDRVHPTYKIVSNRFYAIYDDSPVYATLNSNIISVSSAAYTEDNLLNLTCDELGPNTTQKDEDTNEYKTARRENLQDDVVNENFTAPMELDAGGNGENDAKGWYIILGKQGNSSYCSHCKYEATVIDSEGGRDNHYGEKILSRVLLFDGKAMFTAYQPNLQDPCSPQGNGLFYALNYLDGSAALNLNHFNDDENDEDEPEKKDVTDRYQKYYGIKVIPSSPALVVRDREYKVLTNFTPPIDTKFDGKPALYYWIEH